MIRKQSCRDKCEAAFYKLVSTQMADYWAYRGSNLPSRWKSGSTMAWGSRSLKIVASWSDCGFQEIANSMEQREPVPLENDLPTPNNGCRYGRGWSKDTNGRSDLIRSAMVMWLDWFPGRGTETGSWMIYYYFRSILRYSYCR